MTNKQAALTRRGMLAGGVGAIAALSISPARAVPGARPADPAMTPDASLEILRRGNREFLAGRGDDLAVRSQRRLAVAREQHPLAVLVSCSDSRVPPELLFGRGLGELFIIRNAGNTLDTVATGSMEYAVLELGVPLVVVMGHERCGAVGAAVAVVQDGATFPGSIGNMIEPIIPAVLDARRSHSGDDLLDAAVRANVSRTVRHLRQAALPAMLERQRAGRLRIVGARYDLDDGAVDFFDLG